MREDVVQANASVAADNMLNGFHHSFFFPTRILCAEDLPPIPPPPPPHPKEKKNEENL